MDYGSYLFTLSAFAQISATIFAILLGFSMFLLTQKEKLHKYTFILLLTGILGSIVSCGISIHGLASATENNILESTVKFAELFLFVSVISVAILSVFTIGEMMKK